MGDWPGFTADIVEPMGADTIVWCGDGSKTVQVRTSGTRKVAPGDRLALGLNRT